MGALEHGPRSGGGSGVEGGPRRDRAALLILLTVAAVGVTIPFGPKATAIAAGLLIVALLVAVVSRTQAIVTWPNGIGFLLLVVWFVPIKGYALPVDLPFQLEHYRVTILLLLSALIAGAVTHRLQLGLAGRAGVVTALGAIALLTQVINLDDVDANAGTPGTAVKALSYFLAYLIVYLIVCSALVSTTEIDRVVRFLVAGGACVAASALYEARFGFNVFNHLNEYLPGFERQARDVVEARSGRLRVMASAQHPIALGVALTLVVPQAFYLASRASSTLRQRAWLGVACLLAVGAAATISRTTVAMGVLMLIAAVYVKREQVLRFWPVLLLVPIVVHVVAPGALGGLYKQFFPKGGLVADLEGRPGQGGSGRLADINPGIRLWQRAPLLGNGLGNEFPSSEDAAFFPGKAPPPIIFDNQYLDSLVKMGALGIVAVLVFFCGGAVTLIRRARSMAGLEIVGIDIHIGSQITDLAPYREAALKVLALCDTLASDGIALRHIDLGGGLGIRYRDETPVPLPEYAAMLQELFAGRREALLLEPGRRLVADAGVLLTRVEYLKPGPVRHFAIVDAAMNDLMRPALYDAWHRVDPVRPRAEPTARWDVVGPVCESADFLARDRELALRPGDLLAVRAAGAYAMSMSSNYNARPRACEVMVDRGVAHVVRRRESIADLYALESTLPRA